MICMKTIFCLLMLLAASLSAADLTGKWSGTYDVTVSDGDPMKGRVLMVLTQTGDEITGTIGPDEQQQSRIAKGKVEGDRITFQSQTEGPLMHFDLRLEDNHIRGEAKGEMEDTKIRAKIELTRE